MLHGVAEKDQERFLKQPGIGEYASAFAFDAQGKARALY
jgi:hypothetical protein